MRTLGEARFAPTTIRSRRSMPPTSGGFSTAPAVGILHACAPSTTQWCARSAPTCGPSGARRPGREHQRGAVPGPHQPPPLRGRGGPVPGLGAHDRPPPLIDERRARSPPSRPRCRCPSDDTGPWRRTIRGRGRAGEATSTCSPRSRTCPTCQRQVITLRWVGGLSLAEVAESSSCSVGAVKALQHRGVETLRVRLAAVSPAFDLTFTAT